MMKMNLKQVWMSIWKWKPSLTERRTKKMMEKYFALKYYEEVAGNIISAVVVIGIVIFPIACVVFDVIKKWWKGEE